MAGTEIFSEGLKAGVDVIKLESLASGGEKMKQDTLAAREKVKLGSLAKMADKLDAQDPVRRTRAQKKLRKRYPKHQRGNSYMSLPTISESEEHGVPRYGCQAIGSVPADRGSFFGEATVSLPRSVATFSMHTFLTMPSVRKDADESDSTDERSSGEEDGIISAAGTVVMEAVSVLDDISDDQDGSCHREEDVLGRNPSPPSQGVGRQLPSPAASPSALGGPRSPRQRQYPGSDLLDDREEQRRGAQPSVGANSETPTEAVSRKQYTGSRLEDSFPLAAAQHWLEDAAVGAGEAGVKEFELHLRPLSRQGTPPSRHPTPFVPRSDPSSDFRRVESPAQNPELSAARPDSSVGIRRKEPPPRRPFDTSGSPRDPQEGSGTPRDVPGRKAGSDGEEVRGERPGRGDDAEVVKVLRRKRESIGGKGGIVADILDEGAVMDPYKAHPMDSAQDLDFQARGNAQQQLLPGVEEPESQKKGSLKQRDNPAYQPGAEGKARWGITRRAGNFTVPTPTSPPQLRPVSKGHTANPRGRALPTKETGVRALQGYSSQEGERARAAERWQTRKMREPRQWQRRATAHMEPSHDSILDSGEAKRWRNIGMDTAQEDFTLNPVAEHRTAASERFAEDERFDLQGGDRVSQARCTANMLKQGSEETDRTTTRNRQRKAESEDKASFYQTCADNVGQPRSRADVYTTQEIYADEALCSDPGGYHMEAAVFHPGTGEYCSHPDVLSTTYGLSERALRLEERKPHRSSSSRHSIDRSMADLDRVVDLGPGPRKRSASRPSSGGHARLVGVGSCIFPNGDTYDGQYVNGVPHGYGYHKRPGKDVYAGTFRNGERCGSGVCLFEEGDTYEGTFTGDLPSGVGTFTSAGGEVYQGELFQGQVHGWGVRFFPNGTKAAGKWHQCHLQWSRIISNEARLLALPTLDIRGVEAALDTATAARREASLAAVARRKAEQTILGLQHMRSPPESRPVNGTV